MDVFIANTRVRLVDGDLLGEGGEARVFRWKDQAVKVFHPVDPKDAVAVRARALKLEKLQRFPARLPPGVIAPKAPVVDQRGQVIGFTMDALERVEDASRLSQRKFRSAGLDNLAVQRHFAALRDLVAALHRQGVVVGDLNDGNVLVQPATGRTFLIDADSLQLGGLPCAVAHERFLDPRLYGVDLASAPRFDEGSDWFAFAVMFFASLLYVHPFGGTHATLPTPLRRAEARHSVLKPDVTLPRVAAPWTTLSDDALHYFAGHFDDVRRAPPPDGLFSQRWTTCRCGLVHARAACPGCKTMGPLAAQPAVRVKGRCTAKIVFRTQGRVVTAAMQGGVTYAWEADGVVRREDGTLVLERPLATTERLGLAGRATWLADGSGQLTKLEGGKVVERAQTGRRGHEPFFATAAQVVYRSENEWLLDANSGARVGQILEGQTFLWSGERLGLGLYRAGGVPVVFLVRTGRPGLRQLPELAWRGRIEAAHAVFDASHALLSLTLDDGGRSVVHRWLVSADGQLLGRSVGGRPGHAALLGGRVVLGTDDGLVALRLDGDTLVEAACFTDSQPFVSAQDELLPMSDGSLVVVTSNELVQVSLS